MNEDDESEGRYVNCLNLNYNSVYETILRDGSCRAILPSRGMENILQETALERDPLQLI